MTDSSHLFGSDLALSATGDLLPAGGIEEGKQRILRRLLTNPGDYPWHPEYGAGLPSYIGRPLDEPALATLIKGQMYAEGGVSREPEPQVILQPIPNGISVRIAYTALPEGLPAYLNFDVTP